MEEPPPPPRRGHRCRRGTPQRVVQPLVRDPPVADRKGDPSTSDQRKDNPPGGCQRSPFPQGSDVGRIYTAGRNEKSKGDKCRRSRSRSGRAGRTGSGGRSGSVDADGNEYDLEAKRIREETTASSPCAAAAGPSNEAVLRRHPQAQRLQRYRACLLVDRPGTFHPKRRPQIAAMATHRLRRSPFASLTDAPMALPCGLPASLPAGACDSPFQAQRFWTAH